MNFTQNYQLNQWEALDKVQRTDFNADNAKIDAALRALDTGKAEKSALNTLSQTVAGHTAALAGKGNCQIATGTYTGDGTIGAENKITLTFPFAPKLVIVQNSAGALADVTNTDNANKVMMVLVRPLRVHHAFQGYYTTYITWADKSVSWYSENSFYAHMNMKDQIYTYVALG